MIKKNVIIVGAAGRDFHNFNTYYRNNELYEVVAFTATQIPDIVDRKYPSATVETGGQVVFYPVAFFRKSVKDIVFIKSPPIEVYIQMYS